MQRGFLDRPGCRLYYEVDGSGPFPLLRPRPWRQSPELVTPPTSTLAAWPRALAGTTVSRSRSTSAIAASDSLGALGVAWIRALSSA